MKYLQFAVATAVALLFSGAALTQFTAAPPPATDPASTLGALDTDKDGSISRAEAAANPGLASQFPALDSNTNNALEPAEFSRFESTGTTRGTPGAPGSPGSPASPTPPPPISPPPPNGTTPPPSSGSTAPSGSSTAPGSNSPPPGGG